ncbi:Exosome RNA helicase MTR4 [Gryganskiella cystojenkinii]|nr:Exosome RNA helicase MTR4 [Gryganskiella cystojenkinii]
MFFDDPEAFDVFDETNADDFSTYEGNDKSATSAPSRPSPPSKKRTHALQGPARKTGSSSSSNPQTPTSLSITTSNTQDMDQDMAVDQEDGDSSLPGFQLEKRPRLTSPMPTVTDSFEQDLTREVAASAGLMNSVDASNVILNHQVRHQVALPPNWKYTPLSQHIPQDPPAKSYPFTLDPFQKLATYSIERGESVLVSAHTSAGKTVVAEFAIATALRDKQRVVYTSPIKALSNQKYRELLSEFGDVGLMTGDVVINPSASCLVMTTEILRGMLYNGSQIMREVSWVIFDEIHYMRDTARGVVWEETIILLPASCHYVFLSATIPNAMEFAEWICKIKEQPCHIVYTNFRPTPLQHYLFPAGAEGIHLVVDEKGQFREENFQKAIGTIDDSKDGKGKKSKKKNNNNILTDRGGGKGKGAGVKDNSTDGPADIYKIIKMIQVKNYYPVIVFSFSKRECEALALETTKMKFNSESESKLVDEVFTNAVSSLSEEDLALPQIARLSPLLRRGVGIHHAGLLPILKEVVELLFQEGLIKVLFATETFSIGVNMPAKTVVFTSVRKFDGDNMRWLSGGEYIQMSGRAGRRGLDERGIVIMMLDEKMEPPIAKEMVLGTTDPLNSAFHLSYSMILNLMRIEGLGPDYMLERCFFQFQNNINIPVMQRELAQLNGEYARIAVENEGYISKYHDIRVQLALLSKELRAFTHQIKYSKPFLEHGRSVWVKIGDQDFGWGVLLSCKIVRSRFGSAATRDLEPTYVLDVLLNCAKGSTFTKDAEGLAIDARAAAPGEVGDFTMIPVPLSSIECIGSLRIMLPKDLRQPESRQSVFRSLQELKKKFPDGLPAVDPIEDMGIRDVSFQQIVRRIEVLEQAMTEHALSQASPEILRVVYGQYLEKAKMSQKIKDLKRRIADAKAIAQLDELRHRKRVLRRLGFTTNADVIEAKGRVACELNTGGDELLLTELLFSNAFNALSVEQMVALMSCFCLSAKVSMMPPILPEELAAPLRMMQEMARSIVRVEKESKLNVDEKEYVEKFKHDLMEVAFAWAKGASFETLLGMTEAFEGEIVRVLRSMYELMLQLCNASRIMGNTELEDKFKAGCTSIKRGIVFASSLYL